MDKKNVPLQVNINESQYNILEKVKKETSLTISQLINILLSGYTIINQYTKEDILKDIIFKIE